MENNTQNQPQGKPANQKKIIIYSLLSVGILIVAIGALLIARQIKHNKELLESYVSSPYFIEGVEINGIAVGGLTKSQAKKLIEKDNSDELSKIAFSLKYEEISYPTKANAFGFTSDTDAVMDNCFLLGKEGTLREIEAIRQETATNKKSFKTSFTCDINAVNSFVDTVAKAVDRPPIEAEFLLKISKDNVTPSEMKTSEYVNKAATTTQDERFVYQEHQDGLLVDKNALKDILIEMAEKYEFYDVNIPMEVTKPNVTIEDIKKQVTLRGKSQTSFAKSPYNRSTRVYNIKKAAGLINGTIVQPGEVFSTNTVLGNRTYAAGWKPAPAIVQGTTEDQAGGGVCQVSSTMYLAVLMSDLEIVYRQGHSERLSYVSGGLDATIDSGRIDFKWKNNTNYPVYVFAYVDESAKTLHFEIYGEEFKGEFDEIQLSSKRLSSISPSGSMVYQVDYTKDPSYSKTIISRKSGSKWQSYATYLKDGVEIDKRTIDTTTYKAYAGLTIIGPPAGI